VAVGVYAVAWIGAILAVALAGDAATRAGEGSGESFAAWILLLAVVGFVGGFVGAVLASAS